MATQRRSSVFQFQLEGVEGPRVEIGRGSYALVEEYDFKGLLVAGKSFHRNVYDRASVRERETMLKRFEIECKTLSQLHHPHIIQFLGVYVKEGSSLPVLLMERLYSTLAALIDCHGKLPDEYCYSILHDVAVALRYLHSHTSIPIIHRDLTANNILLTTDMIAKISDVGVAEIVNLNPTHKIRVSTCPGTPSYVPPETLVARPIYAVTVDVFAYGNLMVHVFCGRWPIPTEMFRPNGITPLNEVERREEYLSNVGSMHPLMGLIRKCLSNKPVARPDVFEILSTVKEVMPRFPLSLEIKIKFFRRIQAGATYEDAVSKQPEQNKQSNSKGKQAAKENQIQAFVAQLEQLQRRTEEELEILSDAHGIKVENLHVQLNELRVEAESLKSTMRAKEVRLSAKKNEVEAKQAIIKANEQQIKTAQAIITSKEQELKLKNQELAFKEQQLTNKNMLLNAKDQEISTLHEEISRKGTNLLAKETTAASLMSQENPPPIPPRMHSLSGKGLSILYDEVPHEGNSLQATQTTKVSLKIHKRSRSDSPYPPRARSSSESKGPTNKTLTRLHSDSVLTLRQYQTSQTYKGPVPSVVVYEQEQYDDVITRGVARPTEGNASATSYTRPPPIPFPRPVQARRRKISPVQLETARNRSSQTDDRESNIIGKSFPMTPQTEEPTSPNKAEKSPESRPLPPEPSAGAFEVVAMNDYPGREKGQLRLTKGQEVIILNDSREYWWTAQNEQGREGYVPRDHVKRVKLDWCFPALSQMEAERILKAEGKEGGFVVTKSSSKNIHTLSVCHNGQVKHYPIKQDDSKNYFITENHRFLTIKKLIDYHKINCAGSIVTRLRKPPVQLAPNFSTPSPIFDQHLQIDKAELRLGRDLGIGQFARVVAGKWKGKLDVAIKMMKERAMNEEDFIDEAKLMKDFQHKNLVKLYGVCMHQGPLFVVTELMVNGCLLQYLRQHEDIVEDTKVILHMATQICSAMKYLEANRFIHRDLAARNCLVGERNIVKVADFGLTRFVIDDEYTASEGTKFCTKWAAPEVLSHHQFSSKSDAWESLSVLEELCILLWELWTGGKAPYPDIHSSRILNELQRGYRLEKPTFCPDGVRDLMLKCWLETAEERPSFVMLFDSLQQINAAYDAYSVRTNEAYDVISETLLPTAHEPRSRSRSMPPAPPQHQYPHAQKPKQKVEHPIELLAPAYEPRSRSRSMPPAPPQHQYPQAQKPKQKVEHHIELLAPACEPRSRSRSSSPAPPQHQYPQAQKPKQKVEQPIEAIEEWEINRKQITLVETLGEGQFGEVWEGLWNGITRVAVKILKANILNSFAFFREAGPLKNLRHPKLLRYHAVCIEEDEILIVCELMKHGSLVLYLRGGGRTQKLPELLDISAQVAAGMCYLEKQNFVHRNLTAKNILVGEHIVCKVADFGLAAMISDDPYAAETGYNYHIRWTSPEAASYSEFTTKSDVWSFGVVLYEIITYGRPPYSGMSRKEVLDSVSSGYRMPCPPGCPDKLYDVMMECWNETPQKRPTFESLHWKLEDFNDKGYQTVH